VGQPVDQYGEIIDQLKSPYTCGRSQLAGIKLPVKVG
jgi:hypothetical protein